MSIRLKLILACVALLALNSGLGYFARYQQHQMGERAMGIYDGAYLGLNYVTSVQTGVIRFAASHSGPSASVADPAAQNDLAVLTSNLDVAIERAMTDKARSDGHALRAKLETLTHHVSPEALTAGLTAIDRDLTKLVHKYGADGLAARDGVEEAVNGGDQLVLIVSGSIAALSFGTCVLLGWSVIPPLRRAVVVATRSRVGSSIP